MICILNETETRWLESEGIAPCCKGHAHIEAREARELVRLDIYRYVGPYKRRVTQQASNFYIWKARLSGGANVLQLCKIVSSRRQNAKVRIG